jgi:hypothetical protein
MLLALNPGLNLVRHVCQASPLTPNILRVSQRLKKCSFQMRLGKILLVEHHLIGDLCFECESQGSENGPDVEVDDGWTVGLLGKVPSPVLANVAGKGLSEVCIHGPFVMEFVDDWEVAEEEGVGHDWLDSSEKGSQILYKSGTNNPLGFQASESHSLHVKLAQKPDHS